MSTSTEKEELLLQAVKTQRSILQLLELTLQETYLNQKGLPEKEQNSDVMNLAYSARSIIAKKPKLKEIYKQLEEQGIEL
ncbi:hypothetical protein [Aquibacillus kalidii]|uniref:hypothetical protein n=1 Tax=Aquibacillus kalidii TaxID=2762597 RepID=UPI0016462F37|nr:hypothetical protein [Aquibacillus kalidii]